MEGPVPTTFAVRADVSIHPFYSRTPLLPRDDAAATSSYQGRVVVEVWERDTYVLVVGDGSVQRKAHDALTAGTVAIRHGVPPVDRPVTHPRLAEPLLGRVVVEIWEDRVLAGLIGGRAEVLDRAQGALQPR